MRLVLVGTQMPENFGFVLRVMGNFGLKDLFLVAPSFDLGDEGVRKKVEATATWSAPLLGEVTFAPDLKEALKGVVYVVGTSSFERDMMQFYQTPYFFAKDMHNRFPCEDPGGNEERKKIACIFGPESTGLTNEDLSLCQAIVSIPTSKDHPSMNLSHAVGIIAYEWYKLKHIIPDKTLHLGKTCPAKQEDLHFFLNHFERHLDRVNFWRVPHKKAAMKRNLFALFKRMELTSQELRTLHGVIDVISHGNRDKN